MEENKEEIANEITPETTKVVTTPKPRKPRLNKSTEAVEPAIEIPAAEENQEEPFLEELDSLIELEPKKDKKDKKKKKNKKKEKEKEKKKAKAKAKKAKKAKKEKAKKIALIIPKMSSQKVNYFAPTLLVKLDDSLVKKLTEF